MANQTIRGHREVRGPQPAKRPTQPPVPPDEIWPDTTPPRPNPEGLLRGDPNRAEPKRPSMPANPVGLVQPRRETFANPVRTRRPFGHPDSKRGG